MIDQYRSRKKVEPLDSAEFLLDSLPDPEQQVIQEEEVSRLAGVIAQLPPDYQQVVVLRYIERLPTAEVAGILNRSDGAVRVLLHRALKQMTEMMVVEEADGARSE